MEDANRARAGAARPLRILIADDSAPIRGIVKAMLNTRSAEWQVCGESPDGPDVLRKAKEIQPDVILLDLSIPGISGLETAKILRRDHFSSTVVLMSAQEPPVLERIAAAAGIPFCISKSQVVADLIPLLETIFAQRHSNRESAAVADHH